MTDTDALVAALDQALDGLLTARIVVGGMPAPLPEAALELALLNHPEVAKARREISALMARLLDDHVLRPEGRDAVMALEETVWRLVGRVAEASWSMALLWATAEKTKDKEWAR